MHGLMDALRAVLIQPTPGALVCLQGALLGEPQGDVVRRALEVAGEFHAYLSDLHTKLAAREYSELASRLDIGAVGGVVVENLMTTDRADFWKRFLVGGVSEVLMVAASRQYVRAWQAETGLVHSRAAWYLTNALWQVSTEMAPALSAEERWQAIQHLVSPAYDPAFPAQAKALLVGRIFQVTLLGLLLPQEESPSGS